MLALDYVFARCQADPSCHQAFPHLTADWSALWASVGRSPWVIPAAQSPSKTTVRLDQDGLANWMYNAMYTGDIGPIPVLVHTLAAAKNKAAALLSVISALQASGQLSPGQGHDTNNTWDLCAGPLTRAFIEQASLAHLNTSWPACPSR